MSSRELSEWIAFSNLEPFGDARGDLQTGIIASTVVNMLKGKEGKPAKPADFIPDFDADPREKKKQTPDQQLKIVEMLNAALRGKDLRKR